MRHAIHNAAFYVIGLIAILVFAAFALVNIATAQTLVTEPGPVVSETSFWYQIWVILQPLAVTFVTAVSSVLIPWLGYKLSSFLQAADEAKRKEIEKQISDALHKSAQNALKFALAKLGIPLPPDLTLPTPVLQEAIEYIRSKNPDAIDAFKLDNTALAEIILSKVPDVKAIVAAGEVIGSVINIGAAANTSDVETRLSRSKR